MGNSIKDTNKDLIRTLSKELFRLIDINYESKESQDKIGNIEGRLANLKDEDAIRILEEEIEKEKLTRRSAKKGRSLFILLSIATTILFVAITVVYLSGPPIPDTKKDSSSSSKVIANAKEQKIENKKSEEVTPFEVLPYKDNAAGKVIPSDYSDNSLTGDAKKDIELILFNAEHRPAALESYATLFGINVDGIEWIEKKGDKEFLSKDAQAVYHKLRDILLFKSKAKHTDDVGVTGYATGVNNNNFVQDSRQLNYKGWSGVVIEYQDYNFYILDYCGNPIFNKYSPGVKIEELPMPSTPPGKEKPKPTPPPTSKKPEPKDPKKDPVQNGNAQVGGGKNADQKVTEPANNEAPKFAPEYKAPEAPVVSESTTTQEPSTKATVEIKNAPSGKFSDSNGDTSVSKNGAVTTPKANYDALVPDRSNKHSYTPPKVQNKDTDNSGVNDGYMDGNSIPID